jgi:hypothetical protein
LLAFRLELTKDQPRVQTVIKTVAEMSDFGRRRPGRGLGLAFSDLDGTVSAGVAEVSVDHATGKISFKGRARHDSKVVSRRGASDFFWRPAKAQRY